MTEHAATTATTTATTAHFVPVGEEITAAVVAAERAAPGMVFVMPMVAAVFAVTECVTVMVVMKGVEKDLAHAHDKFRYIVEVT
ncbi:hypothetical protein [Rhodanobacter sp. C05]|uniref:hypothetical protein n=1 Tax=Rhodanobacter sp. C05 TaxID=1945855 RepID=UPI0020C2CCFF|nr:hypothetical protein [Rhodanobacter sp. C05]